MARKPRSNDKTVREAPLLQSRLFCQTHLEIPVGDMIFHIFSVANNKKFAGWNFRDDCHNHHELIYTVQGQGIYEIYAKRVVAKKGDFFFTPRGVLHHGWIEPGVNLWESLVVEMDFSLGRDPEIYLDDLGIFPAVLPFYRHFMLEKQVALEVSPELRPQIELIVERLALEVTNRTFDYDLILQSQMLEFLALVCRAAREQLSSVPLRHYAARAKGLMRLEKARRYITQNYTQPVTVRQLAAESCMSPYHFVRSFKEAFGMSPIQYQAHLRLSEAKRLLLSTDMQISEISDRLGYSSPEYFSRQFASKVGVSPSNYTEHMMEQAEERGSTVESRSST
jgi:AraC-like DNA-binding protein